MKLEDQVCSYEQAAELDHLIKEKDSCFYWCGDSSKAVLMSSENLMAADEASMLRSLDYIQFPAYTVAELGEMLGRYQVVKVKDIEVEEEYWAITDLDIDFNITWMSGEFDDKRENEARAEALIFLLENKRTLEDIKL